MTGNWFHIAKAEFQVQTSGFRPYRTPLVLGTFLLGLTWALFLSPIVMSYVVTDILGIPQLDAAMAMPGLMRAGIWFTWMILLILPLSNALQEMKIGQWEILLSNNVTTREILVGSYAGKLAIYGLYVLYLAPLIVAPFAQILEVSYLGRALMYATIFVITVSTIWLSQLVVTAIQARLGASPRGKDLAKSLAIVLSAVAIMPLVGLQLFAPMMSEILGMNVFLLFPFTWGADLMSQLAIAFNGIGISPGVLEAILGLTVIGNAMLLGGFCVVLVILGMLSADRLFTIEAGWRNESVTTIKSENLVLRGVRRFSRGSFGVLVVTGLKDFGRKAQNLSRLALFMILVLVIPVFIYIRAGEVDFTSITVMMPLMSGFLGVQVFGGAGFLESKDQLWTIQAAPNGVGRYIKAKAVQSVVLIVPIVLLPAILYSVLLSFELIQVVFLTSTSFMSSVGGAMVGIGIAATNPSYEDTKSSAYRTNNARGMGLVAVSFMWYLIADMALSMLGYSEIVNFIWESQTLFILAQIIPLPIIGVATILLGSYRLSNRE
ncbi:MAG: hypothetical protein ACFFEA_04130 [Candidatus Thorarchaeota archaeon]